VAERHEPDVDAIARRLYDLGPVPADLLDITGEKLGGLVDGRILVVANHDLAGAIVRRKDDVALGYRPGLNPRPSKGSRPRGGLSGRPAGTESA
jgi:hypothetical protein